MQTESRSTSLDHRGKTITTFVIYDATTELQQMAEGEVLEILTDEFEPFEPDISAWCQATGHVLLALDPGPLSGGAFAGRMLDLVHAIELEPGARLPGLRRLEGRERAARDGVQITAALHDEIQSLINHPA